MAAGIIAKAVKAARDVDGMAFSNVVAALFAVFDNPKKVLELMTEVNLEVDSVNVSRKGRQTCQKGFIAHYSQAVLMIVELLAGPV